MSIARQLYNLMKNWDWTMKQKKTFRELKKRFTKEPVLVTLDLDKKSENESRYIRLCNKTTKSMIRRQQW